MRISFTLRQLTKFACLVGLVMSAFSCETGARHIESPNANANSLGLIELASTCVALLLTLTLLCITTVTAKCNQWVCAVLCLLIAATSCFTLSNALACGLMLICFAGWIHAIAYGPQELVYPNYYLRNGEGEESAPGTKRPALTRAQHLLRVLHSLTGWFGATALVSVVVFIVRFQQLEGNQLPSRASKSSARALQVCFAVYVVPSLERLLPRFCQLVGWRISKRFRIKDCALAKRVVVLGCMYSTMHVLAQFALFVQTCDSHLERLFALDSVLAWASGYPLVWASVVVLATCRSMELARLYYYIQRVGQLMVLVLLLVHVPQITPVLAAFAALVVLDLGMQWYQVFPAFLASAQVLPQGGFSHLQITAPQVSAREGGAINLQILQVSPAFKPFTLFRVPGDYENQFHCLIKTHPGGWTEELEDHIALTKQVKSKMRLFADGPYQRPSSCEITRRFSQFLLFASGVGITVPLSVLGTLDAAKVRSIHLEWSLRASDLKAFAQVFAYLRDWKLSDLPQLSLTINVSTSEENSNLEWLRNLATTFEWAFDIHVGRIPFDQVLTTVGERVDPTNAVVGVFGCASHSYCLLASQAMAKQPNSIQFCNHLEAV
ncbi:hypothetical protein BASA81_001700 [Batrachochytrium salamandrivorans]|nr:hypothetical protein BASA81_001700 [Batrachochytrium salamandrivorans]